MVSDPIGDMLIQIKNAALARKSSVELPYSKLKMAVARALVENGYLTSAKLVDSGKPELHLELAYRGKLPVVTGVKRISKPGLRWYVTKKTIPIVLGGMGIAVVSTPRGVMTGKEAKKMGLGGELLCKVW